MALHFVAEYVVGLAGMVAGAVTGWLIATRLDRAGGWDARVTLPLLLGAGAAHLALIPVVERQRQVMFGLYFLAMAGTFVFAMLRFGIWRLGAVVFPAGSIAAYFYFAAMVHQVDYIGLAVKAVEAAVIVAAIRPLAPARRRRPMPAP
jgi:hypothetical protein